MSGGSCIVLLIERKEKSMKDFITTQELNNYWDSEIHTEDVELANAIKKLDSLIKKGSVK